MNCRLGLFGILVYSTIAISHPLDSLFERADVNASSYEVRVTPSVLSDSSRAKDELRGKVVIGDEKIEARNREAPTQLPAGAATKEKGTRLPANTAAKFDNKRPPEAAASQIRFVCSIYCKSSSGPVIRREFVAGTRKEAANLAGNAADSLCSNANLVKGSSLALPENQCYPK